MLVDGKAIAEEVLSLVKKGIALLPHPPTLGILLTEETPVVQKFVAAKQVYAERIGVSVVLKKLGPMTNTETALAALIGLSKETQGLVVQLPVASGIDMEALRKLLPLSHDVDVLGETAARLYGENRLPIMPPVPAAMKEILTRHTISLRGKRVAVVGEGMLVGKPALVWVKREGAEAAVIGEHTPNKEELLLSADVVILGAGSPGLLTPNLIKQGAVVLDAGTSESAGKMVGDADPACAERASLFTPTPGGIGPVTVAMIFKNLLSLSRLGK